jgi:hypothetical protein
VDPGLPDGPHFGPFWGSPDAPVWGLKPLVSVYWPLEAIPYHARARRYIGIPRSLGSIYGIGTPGFGVLDPKSSSSQPGSWRPGSQMGPFGPPFGGVERCFPRLRSLRPLRGTSDWTPKWPFRPSGTSDLGLAMFNTRISYDTNVSERG